MTDQFSRDHYRDSRQPGENSSRRRVNANPNHRTAGNNARHVSSSRRPAGTRQQTSAHQQGAPQTAERIAGWARTRAAPRPSQNPRQQMRQGAPARNHASSSAGRPLPRERATRIVQSLSRAGEPKQPGQRRRLQRLLPLHRAPLEAPQSCCHRRYGGAYHRHRHWRILCFESAHFRHHRQRSEAHRFQRYDHRQAHRRRTCLPDGGQPARR